MNALELSHFHFDLSCKLSWLFYLTHQSISLRLFIIGNLANRILCAQTWVQRLKVITIQNAYEQCQKGTEYFFSIYMRSLCRRLLLRLALLFCYLRNLQTTRKLISCVVFVLNKSIYTSRFSTDERSKVRKCIPLRRFKCMRI